MPRHKRLSGGKSTSASLVGKWDSGGVPKTRLPCVQMLIPRTYPSTTCTYRTILAPGASPPHGRAENEQRGTCEYLEDHDDARQHEAAVRYDTMVRIRRIKTNTPYGSRNLIVWIRSWTSYMTVSEQVRLSVLQLLAAGSDDPVHQSSATPRLPPSPSFTPPISPSSLVFVCFLYSCMITCIQSGRISPSIAYSIQTCGAI